MPVFFNIQWHITALCDQHCKHCYMYDEPTYFSELKNPLNLKEIKTVIDDFVVFLNRYKMKGRISYTGGDPLLRKDFFDILEYTVSKGVMIQIYGNPYNLNIETAERLKELGLSRYQVSIDGLKKTHDHFRRPGSFKETIKAIRILKKSKIKTAVMFTLSKLNAKELIPVIRLVAKEGVDYFDFSRLTPMGTGKSLKNEILTSYEFRDILFSVFKEYLRLKEKGVKTKFGVKEHLWNLLYKEMGLFTFPNNFDKNIIYSGCRVGMNLLTFLADGTVYSCRRLPIKIGKIPEQGIEEIFINSKFLNEARNLSKWKGCSKCELLQFCRGCLAMSYVTYKNAFAKDPQCWKVD